MRLRISSSDSLRRVTVNTVRMLEFMTTISAGWSGKAELKVHSSSSAFFSAGAVGARCADTVGGTWPLPMPRRSKVDARSTRGGVGHLVRGVGVADLSGRTLCWKLAGDAWRGGVAEERDANGSDFLPC